MYLSAERLALANQAVRETFEQTSVAWQAIPHWETGDPGQTYVRADDINIPAALPIPIVPTNVPFTVTLAQAIAPTPDSLLAQVIEKTVDLAAAVDALVLPQVRGKAKEVELSGVTPPDPIVEALIETRATVEDAGYRAPCCVLTNTEGLKKFSQLVSGYSILETLLTAANANSLHRASQLDEKNGKGKPMVVAVLLGRRQRMAHGSAGDASPGEEPVDLAVSILPSLEVIGETSTNDISLAVRIAFALRITDVKGIAVIVDKV
jgi:hypothetical protein